MTKISIKIIILLTLVFLFTGCVEHKDINELDFVLGAMFDYNPETQQYQVYTQVAKTEAFSKGGGTQEKEGFVIFSGKGTTIFNAVRDMSKNGKRFFWGHCDVYIIGENLAKHGIFDLEDFLMRDNEIRQNAYVFETKTTAKDLLTLKNGVEKVPVLSVIKTLKTAVAAHGETIEVRVRDIFSSLITPHTSYLIPQLEIRRSEFGESKESTDKYNLSGAAVFEGDKIVVNISPLETKSYNYVKNKIEDTLVPFEFQESKMVIEQFEAKTEIKPLFKNGQVSFMITVEPRGNYADLGSQLNLKDPAVTKQVESAFAEEIKSEIAAGIEKSKEIDQDYYGFGRAVEKANPKYWASVKEQWEDEIFPHVGINISVQPKILRTGLEITTKPEEKYVQGK